MTNRSRAYFKRGKQRNLFPFVSIATDSHGNQFPIYFYQVDVTGNVYGLSKKPKEPLK